MTGERLAAKILTTKFDEWIKGPILGAGIFGEVYIATHPKLPGILCAMKRVEVREPSSNDPRHSADSNNEWKELSCLSHQGIVKFYHKWIIQNQLYMLMEFARGHSLEEYIDKCKTCVEDGKVPSKVIRSVVAQLVLVLQYLHSQNVLHRDLKPDNVLLTEDGNVKVIDFGMARTVRDFATSTCGTPLYKSPERLLSKPYTFAGEVYAAGLIFVKLKTGKYLFDEAIQHKKTVEALLEGQKDFETCLKRIIGEGDEMYDLLLGMLQYHTEERWKMERILQHPWVVTVIGELDGK